MLSGGVLLGSQIGGAEPSNDGYSYARYWDGSNFAWTKTPKFDGPLLVQDGSALTNDGTTWQARFQADTQAQINVQTGGTDASTAGIALGDEGNQWKVGVWSYANGDAELWAASEKIYFDASADAIWFETNGANERMRIDSSGNVGIGTASPSGKFHIAAGTVTEPTYGAADQLILQGETATNIYMNIVSDPAKKCGIRFSDTALAPGQIQYDHSDNSMAFQTATGEKVRITSDGLVGIGTSSPGFNIQIYEATKTKGPKISFINVNTGATTGDGFEVGLSSSSEDALIWQRENNPIRFATNNAERARFGASGGFLLKEIADAEADVAGFGQIWVDNTAPNRLYFTDDTGVDQALSTYRGTWTPEITDASFNTSEGQTYTIQSGFYYVIGKMCYIYFDININSLGTMTGTDLAYIVGLPFTCTDGNVPCFISYGGSLAKTGTSSSVTGMVQAGTYINLWEWDTAGGTTGFTIAELSAGGRLIGSALYPVIS